MTDFLSSLGIQLSLGTGRGLQHTEYSEVCPDLRVKPKETTGLLLCWSVREGDSSEMIHDCRGYASTRFLPVHFSV